MRHEECKISNIMSKIINRIFIFLRQPRAQFSFSTVRQRPVSHTFSIYLSINNDDQNTKGHNIH